MVGVCRKRITSTKGYGLAIPINLKLEKHDPDKKNNSSGYLACQWFLTSDALSAINFFSIFLSLRRLIMEEMPKKKKWSSQLLLSI